MATFVGFAPATHPVLSAIVVLNRPTPDLRRDGGGPGVLPDHELRPPPLRHPDHTGRVHHGPPPGTSPRPAHRTSREVQGSRRRATIGRSAGRRAEGPPVAAAPAARIRADEPFARRDRGARDDGRPRRRSTCAASHTTAAGWAPGTSSSASPAAPPTATTTPPRRWPRRSGPPLRAPRRRGGPGRWCRPWSPRDGPPGHGPVAAAFYGHPARRPGHGRGHRHQRQDHGDPPARGRARARRRARPRSSGP